jgi:hypothetical protein
LQPDLLTINDPAVENLVTLAKTTHGSHKAGQNLQMPAVASDSSSLPGDQYG